MVPEKHGINMGLKYMPDFRESYFKKTMSFFSFRTPLLTDI